MCVCVCVCVCVCGVDEAIDGELDGGEEAGIKTDADDEETKKLTSEGSGGFDRFTRAELHFRKVRSRIDL